VTTSYVYTGTGEQVASQTTGSATTSYVYGPDGPLAQSSSAGVRFYLSDPHGDIVGQSNTSGTLTGSVTYDPWGVPRTTVGEQTNLGFQGDPTDPTTGLVDMTTRNYDPTMGEFTTQDVVFGDPTNPTSLNQYIYGQGSPVTFTDPTGMDIVDDFGCDVSRAGADACGRAAKKHKQHAERYGCGDESCAAEARTSYDYSYATRLDGGAYQPMPIPEPPDPPSPPHLSIAQFFKGCENGCTVTIGVGAMLHAAGHFINEHRWQIGGLGAGAACLFGGPVLCLAAEGALGSAAGYSLNHKYGWGTRFWENMGCQIVKQAAFVAPGLLTSDLPEEFVGPILRRVTKLVAGAPGLLGNILAPSYAKPGCG
jgi:RHS repeat-associated protein